MEGYKKADNMSIAELELLANKGKEIVVADGHVYVKEENYAKSRNEK